METTNTAESSKAIYNELMLILKLLPAGIMHENSLTKDIYSKDWIEANNYCINKIIAFIGKRADLSLSNYKKSLTKEFTFYFITGYYKDEGCTIPQNYDCHQLEVLPNRRAHLPQTAVDEFPKTDIKCKAVVTAKNSIFAWQQIKANFPDAQLIKVLKDE
jgi:hypothetical protein